VHVAVTYDESSDQVVFYKDGSASTTTRSNSGSWSGGHNSSADFTIGAQDNSTVVGYVDGKMDEVRVWNVVRTANEIQVNKDIELSGSSSGLVGYWQLNNDLQDATANNNDLTNNGSSTFDADTPFTITGSLAARKASTENIASDATLNDDAELTVELEGNTEYIVDGIIFVNSSSAIPDFKAAFAVPSGSEIDIAIIPSTTREVELLHTSGVESDGIPIPANASVAIQVVGSVKTSSTAGELVFQWSQNVSNATAISVLRGSYLRAEEI
jgi:hypothetical protein